MTLSPKDAEQILRTRYGAPAKEPTDYVIGFRNPVGRVLALHRTIQETRVWFQPPKPQQIDGVTLLNEPNNGNSNINGPLAPLRRPDAKRVEIDSATALHRFLDWYDGGARARVSKPDILDGIDFELAYSRFQDLLSRYDQPFTRFDEGLIAAWESYKPRVRAVALERLQLDRWTSDQIGSGQIVAQVIDAIEIQATHGDLTNNMVFWQNRYGHANRDHRALIEAATTGTGLSSIEQHLFDLYKGDRQEGEVFTDLSVATGGKYPLMTYLFFLKDMDRFMPIQPTGFDRVLSEIGFGLRTLRNCSWANYGIRPVLLALTYSAGQFQGISSSSRFIL